MNYTENVQTKSLGWAIVLTLIFGPLGLFYASVSGGLIMTLTPLALFVLFLLGAVTQSSVLLASSGILLIIFALSYWIICVIWAATSVSNYNNKVVNDSRHEEFLRLLDENNQANNKIVQNVIPTEITKVADNQNLDQPTIKVWKQQNPNRSLNEYYQIYGVPQSPIVTPTYTYEEAYYIHEKPNNSGLYITLAIIAVVSITLLVFMLKFKKEYYIKGLKIYGLQIEWVNDTQTSGKNIHFINSIYEFELNFLSDTEVELTPIVCYDCNQSKEHLPFKKAKYDYNYSKGNLQIPSMEIDINLSEKDSMFICSDNRVFYKYSMSQINESSKKDRLNKLLKYPKTERLNWFLSREVIVKNL